MPVGHLLTVAVGPAHAHATGDFVLISSRSSHVQVRLTNIRSDNLCKLYVFACMCTHAYTSYVCLVLLKGGSLTS